MDFYKRKQSHIRKTCCFIISIIMLLTCFPRFVSAKERNEAPIKVGVFEGTYNVVNDKGERGGYGYEYLQYIAGYTGWSYDYVESSWAECFLDLEKGKVDILGGISYTDERAEKMLFSDMPMGEERYYIYTNFDNGDLSASTLSSFNGKNIGVLKGYIPEDVLNAWEERNGLTMNHVNISTVEEILTKLKNKEIDCFVSVEEATWSGLGISAVTSIGESSVYFAINKDRPDIKASLDNAMRRIKDDNPFYIVDLYRRYLSTQCSSFLSQEEKDWITNHGAITIGYLNDDIGVSVMDPKTGKLTGVITDYLNIAKNSLQGQTLTFELKGYDTRAEQLEALHSGEIDMIFHVSQNPYSAEKNGFVLSDTVWSFNLAAITANSSFDENAKNSVAVSKDNFALKAYISYNYPQWTIKEYDSQSSALKAMETGEVDCVLRNSSLVSDIVKNKKLNNFYLTKLANASFAICKGEPLLLSIMNKTLMAVSVSKLSGAVVSYSNGTKKVTITDFLSDNLWQVFSFLLVVMVLICVLLIQSILRGKKAKSLNVELNSQKTQLEDALKEANLKSEIIGSVSKIYSFIYRINLLDDTYEEISPDMDIQKVAGRKGSYSKNVDKIIRVLVAEEYCEIMGQFMSLSSIMDSLKDMDSISMEYRTLQNTWQMGQLIVKNRDENGQVTEVLYAVRQIDKQKERENRYKEKILFNSRIVSGLSTDYTAAFILNLDTDEYEFAFNQSTNNAKEDSSIKTFREYVEQYVNRFVLPEFKDSMKKELNIETIRKHFVTEKDYHYAFETIPNAAGLSCFQVHIIREYDAGGHFAFLGFRSIDEAIKQEREYKKNIENELKLITSSLPGGMKISNDDETYSFKFVSEQFATMLGYDSPKELKNACGGCIAGLVHPDDLQAGIADALDQYSRSNQYATTYRMRCKDGSYKYIEDRGQKVITKDGTVEHWNLILDKNEYMKKSIALESAKKASKSKSDFLARMSHDMRTPLNGIVGLIKINQDHFDDIKLVKENYRKMEIAAEHLQSLINDVLQMSKIEDGTVPLTHEVIDFVKLSDEIFVMMEQRAQDNDIELEFSTKKKNVQYPLVYGSPLHLKQIFMNIYSNGIKYNRPGGKVTTVADFDLLKDGRCVYRWTISDTGIGMSKEFIKHIFEAFVQEKVDARSVYQGVGLGMPIVKGLVERMGGTITVDSEEGVGSTFIIQIPFDVANAPEKKTEKEKIDASIQGLHLLLAEDNDLNAEIAQTILDDAGAIVTMTRDGKHALDEFAHSKEGTFDAILMDILMPKMNGYETTREIRKLDRKDAKTIPIIAMTANAFAEDKQKCLDAGMNEHLSKPLELDKLKKIVCEQIALSKEK